MLRNLRFQSKLVLVLLVPLSALAAFSALGIRDRLAVLDANEQYEQLDEPTTALSKLSSALEQESVASAWFVATDGAQGTTELDAARADTDDAVAGVEDAVPGFAAAGVNDETNRVLGSLGDRLETLESQRDRIDRRVEGVDETRDYFLSIDDQAIEVTEHMARELADNQVSAGLFGMVDLRRAAQASARTAGIVVPALATGEMSPTERAEYAAAIDTEATYRTRFFSIATEEEQQAFEASEEASSGVLEQMSSSRTAQLLSRLPAITVTASEWYDLNTRKATVYEDGISFVGDAVNDTASAQASDASNDLLLYAFGALLAIGFAVTIAVVVARQTTKPLMQLTTAAKDVSSRQLPQLVDTMRRGAEPDLENLRPIPAASRDEIGELAHAFNSIQSVAVAVAREQSALLRRGISDLFVNLARRNQGLIDRQIELIDRLEQEEQDPDALQALFRLDHLATRMRRNAESLLVLADAEQLRRWQEPVPLLDVVRGAVSEIADFARVSTTGIDDDVHVTGNAAADLTHLLAELLENATSFSPPHTPVTVRGSLHEGGVILAISDEGLGMPEDRLAEANKLLANPPAAGLALSRILGLYVVGHLATRHGIKVELQPGRERGLTAFVVIPPALMARAADTEPAQAEMTGVVAPNGDGTKVESAAGDDAEAPFWSVDSWVASLLESPPDETEVPEIPEVVEEVEEVEDVEEDEPSHVPALRAEPEWAALPARPSQLTTREPGRNLLHLPIRRDGLVDVGSDGSREPGRSRPDEVRSLLADHRRGIERADTVDDPEERTR